MTNFRNLVIAPLNAAHDRAGFHCNVEALDQYIHKQAGAGYQTPHQSYFRCSVAGQPQRGDGLLQPEHIIH